jgi:hypothetical protein
MDYAVYVNDVEHIVLDNLQFMLGVTAGRGFDKFDSQERALDLFRQFATSKNVHITLVVHPRYNSLFVFVYLARLTTWYQLPWPRGHHQCRVSP